MRLHTNEERAEGTCREDAGAAVTLVCRRLSPAEARLLHEELKTTTNIFGYTVPELLRFREMIIAEADGVFAGACLSKDLLFDWTDIAALYVLPAFRGRGVGTLLYAAAFERARGRGRHVFTLSRSPEVIHLMERLGMALTRSVWKAPLPAHLHMNRHMMSRYRLREMLRKAKLRGSGGPALTAGMKRRNARSG